MKRGSISSLSEAEYAELITALGAQGKQRLRIDEIAKLCGCSRTSFWRWRMRHKDFPVPRRNGHGHKLFLLTDVVAWAKKQRANVKTGRSSGSSALPCGP